MDNLLAIDITGSNTTGLDGNPEISQEQLNAINTALEQSVGTDVGGALQIMGFVGLGLNVLSLLMFIASAIGLYKLSKKLGDSHSWLAFVPLIQLYTYIKTAGYSFGKGLLLLIGYGIVAWIVTIVLMLGLGPILNGIAGSGSTAALVITSLIGGILTVLIMVIVATFFLYAGMAGRAGQTNKTALLMTLFPWCMMWIVANRIPDNSDAQSQKASPQASNVEL